LTTYLCKYKNIGNYRDKAEEQSRLKCKSYAMLRMLCTQAAYVEEDVHQITSELEYRDIPQFNDGNFK
jgi:hypothetical protein